VYQVRNTTIQQCVRVVNSFFAFFYKLPFFSSFTILFLSVKIGLLLIIFFKEDADKMASIEKLYNALDDLDDVQNVYYNAEEL